jgi:uncharacterized protein YggE
MRTRHVIWLAGALLTASLFAGIGLPLLARADTKPATVTVQGTGTIETVPDTATMTFGVTTRGDTAAAALADNSSQMTKVIAALKSTGVAAKDIQTQTVSTYRRDDGSYEANNTVSAIVRDVARVGDVTDAAVGAGANVVGGPSLAKDSTDGLYRDALKKAYVDAKAKAGALADAAGMSLGALQSISEGAPSLPVPYAGISAKDTSVPVEPGTQQVQATITVTFALG